MSNSCWDKIMEIRQEYGVTDFFGIWLFEDGMFLDFPQGEDHRILGNPFTMVASGHAVSLRKSANGEMYIRALDEHFYPAEIRHQIERVGDGLDLVVSWFDEDGAHVASEETNDNPYLLLKITDPIAYQLEAEVYDDF